MVESQKHCAEQMNLDWLKLKELREKIVNFLKQSEARGHKTTKQSKIKVEIAKKRLTKPIASDRATIISCAREKNVYKMDYSFYIY